VLVPWFRLNVRDKYHPAYPREDKPTAKRCSRGHPGAVRLAASVPIRYLTTIPIHQDSRSVPRTAVTPTLTALSSAHFVIGSWQSAGQQTAIECCRSKGVLMRLQYKLALITGGSEGIGLAIAEALVREGTELCIVGRDPDKLARAREQLGTSVKLAVSADLATEHGNGSSLAAKFATVACFRDCSDCLNVRPSPPFSHWVGG